MKAAFIVTIIFIIIFFTNCNKAIPLEPPYPTATPTIIPKTFGSTGLDAGHSVYQTSDGGYIITGKSGNSTEGTDVYLLKIDATGNCTWAKTYGGSDYDSGQSVKQTSDGGYIITGESTLGAGYLDVCLIKTDQTGNQTWIKSYGGSGLDGGNSVQQTTDGGFIVTGRTYSFGSGDGDVYLIKTDGNGNEGWSKTFGGISVDEGASGQQTNDDGFIVTGLTHSFGAGASDVYLIKTDGDGNTNWVKTLGGSGFDNGFSVQQTGDGGFIVAGSTNGFGAAANDFYIIKTNIGGSETWHKIFGGSDYDNAFSLEQTSDGGYIVVGEKWSINTTVCSIYLLKIDSTGGEVWSRTFGNSGWNMGRSVMQTSDGGFIIAGSTTAYGAGSCDVYLIKTDANGNQIW